MRPLPEARELLDILTRDGVPWAIATSGGGKYVQEALPLLGIGPNVPVITRSEVERAKPDPDLFLAPADRLGVDIRASIIIGDSVWDLLARRAAALGVGVLSGGYGQDEVERAYRVYEDSLDLLQHLNEVGVRRELMREFE